MLVLTRKFQQQIKIGEGITVTILRVKGQTVRVGIDAPRDVRVIRGELPRDGQPADGALADNAAECAGTTIVVEADHVAANEAEVEPADDAGGEDAGGSGQARLAATSTPAAPRLPQRKRFNRTTSPPLRLAMSCASLAK